MSQYPPDMPRMLFYGCWGEPGHYLFTKSKRTVHRSECEKWEYPFDSELDCSRLLLPYPEAVGHGQRTYLPALHVTILSWWSAGVFDTRGKVNSHFLFKGRNGTELMWDAFCHNFPDLAKHHQQPKIIERY